MALEVLEAQEIWYPVVWQEIKYPPNVIDYNINQEQTKDTSSITNANNQTTTWLANVIPWVNAPKLRAETSISWISAWTSITMMSNVSVPIRYNSSWEYKQLDSWITILNEWWAWFTEASWTVYVWRKWIYNITVNIPFVFSSSWYNKTITIKNNWSSIFQAITALNENKTFTFNFGLNKEDQLTFFCQVSGSSWALLDWTMSIIFVKQ